MTVHGQPRMTGPERRCPEPGHTDLHLRRAKGAAGGGAPLSFPRRVREHRLEDAHTLPALPCAQPNAPIGPRGRDGLWEDAGTPQSQQSRDDSSPSPWTPASQRGSVSGYFWDTREPAQERVAEREPVPGQKSCSSGMSLYRSRVSGFEKAPRCSTALPAMICFTATSTFLPLRVYCRGRGEGGGEDRHNPYLSLSPGERPSTCSLTQGDPAARQACPEGGSPPREAWGGWGPMP